MALGQLAHYVRTLERSVHFYRDILGWRQILGDSDGELREVLAALTARGSATA